MSIIADQSAPLATAVSAASGVAITPAIIQQILTALMGLLTQCVPVAGAPAYVANPKLLARLMIRMKGREYAPAVEPDIIEAAVLDTAQSLTEQDWVAAYSEAGK